MSDKLLEKEELNKEEANDGESSREEKAEETKSTGETFDEDEEDDFSPIKFEEKEQGKENKGEDHQEENLTEEENVGEGDSENKDKKHSDKKLNRILKSKKVWKPTGIIVGTLACVYIAGVIFYSNHFFMGTKISGNNYSNMKVDTVTNKLVESVNDYKFILYERDGKEETVSGKDIGLDIATMGSVGDLKTKQNPWLWCFDYGCRDLFIDISVNIDEEKLYSVISQLNCVRESDENIQGQYANVYYANGAYYIENDPSKNYINLDMLCEKIRAGIYGMYTDMKLQDEDCYVELAGETHIKGLIDKLNNFVATKITYTNGDETYLLDGNTIHYWIKPMEDYSVYLDFDAIKDWTAKLATHYDTVGTTRTFVSSTGESVSVSGGDYGWNVNSVAEAEYLAGVVGNAKEETREPVYKQTAASHGSIDIGNTYAEVSIANQHVWFYKDGELLVSTDCVTGDPTKGNSTSTGVYSVTYKERNATLVGPGYSTPVTFWMPFNGGQGLHDLNRGAYGGSIYRGNGSHGCVNLPWNAAATIFGAISAGDPVIVY